MDHDESGPCDGARREPPLDTAHARDEDMQNEQDTAEDTGIAQDPHISRPYSVSYDTPHKVPSTSDHAPPPPEAHAGKLRTELESLKQELARARESAQRQALVAHRLAAVERERDRYRATVLSLAYQNKVLNDELSESRKGKSGQEEKYVDARLQVQDLKEALALKEMQVEELQSARDFMPTSDLELLKGYKRMRDVFESLRSSLSCSLCYELYKYNDVTTLECGHTMCRPCLQKWSDTHIRLYNLATTPDCPECRQPGRRYVKVFLLEEIVRIVDRLEKMELEEEASKQAERKARLLAAANARPSQSGDSAMEEGPGQPTVEVSAALLSGPMA